MGPAELVSAGLFVARGSGSGSVPTPWILLLQWFGSVPRLSGKACCSTGQSSCGLLLFHSQFPTTRAQVRVAAIRPAASNSAAGQLCGFRHAFGGIRTLYLGEILYM